VNPEAADVAKERLGSEEDEGDHGKDYYFAESNVERHDK